MPLTLNIYYCKKCRKEFLLYDDHEDTDNCPDCFEALTLVEQETYNPDREYDAAKDDWLI